MKDEIKSGIKSGLLSAIIPHIGCIALILITILGVGAGSIMLKKFVLSSWSFPALVLLSFVIAGMSSFIYFKRNCCKDRIKYTTTLITSILIINALVFYVIFPWIANYSGKPNKDNIVSLSEINIKLDIPCSGHAPLIIDELKKAGVSEVVFKMPDEFSIKYNENKISKESILSIDILEEFSANELN